ncbi:hypothetical protein B0T26DRAFT_806863 [Lasiosphaeria miniovina]|uniref:Uncharacterized protein n=1 Tax=Lasiosphaeria miniovina TaxID=1954250 RepID=A0AA39ZT48_9PEZI|nr:uncharacterized protein B0T26DRAFT_806863 [Lasiosphaeria miniovina]KAK0703157.1 hypothetical protein B0T26DRAFT_806863 [Lasiosphaeria miniovina]
MAPRTDKKRIPTLARQPQTAPETNEPVSKVKTLRALGAELQQQIAEFQIKAPETNEPQQFAEFQIKDEVDDNEEVKNDDQRDVDDTYDLVDLVKAKQENNQEFISRLKKRLNSINDAVNDLFGQVGDINHVPGKAAQLGDDITSLRGQLRVAMDEIESRKAQLRAAKDFVTEKKKLDDIEHEKQAHLEKEQEQEELEGQEQQEQLEQLEASNSDGYAGNSDGYAAGKFLPSLENSEVTLETVPVTQLANSSESRALRIKTDNSTRNSDGHAAGHRPATHLLNSSESRALRIKTDNSSNALLLIRAGNIQYHLKPSSASTIPSQAFFFTGNHQHIITRRHIQAFFGCHSTISSLLRLAQYHLKPSLASNLTNQNIISCQHTTTPAKMDADVTSFMYAHIHPVLRLNRDLAPFGVFVAVTDMQGVERMGAIYHEQLEAAGHRMSVLALPDVDGPARVALFCRCLPDLILALDVLVLHADGVDIIFADVESALFALRRRRPAFVVAYWAPTSVASMFFA